MLSLGTIYLVTDIDVIATNQIDPSRKQYIIALTEDNEFLRYFPDAMQASILLPPYESLIYLTDGDMNNFRQIYLNYLSTSPEANMLMSIILKAVLFNGLNIIFYVPSDENELGFFPVIAEYMFNCYGIVIGNPITPFAYIPTFDSVICDKLYMDGIIDIEEYMLNYPIGVGFTQLNVINKLSSELKLQLDDDAQLSDYAKWLYDYKEEIRLCNKFLKRGLIKIPC